MKKDEKELGYKVELVSGIFVLAVGLGLILVVYGYLSGLAHEHEQAKIIIFPNQLQIITAMMLITLLMGLYSGYEITKSYYKLKHLKQQSKTWCVGIKFLVLL